MDSYDDEGVRTGRAGRAGPPPAPGDGPADPADPSAPGEIASPYPPGEIVGPHPPDGTAGPYPPGEIAEPPPPAGIAGLSLPGQVVAAVALAVIAVLACVHLAMVFLHVAPSNTLTKQNGEAVDEWIYPEFEQNWKLFAPNPLQQNIAVQVRAVVASDDGGRRTTGWIDLSAQDAEQIRGNPLPSHAFQNELRRGWDFYVNSHNAENEPNGMRGELSERYVRRMVMLRLGEDRVGGRVERIQVRSETRWVEAPPWSAEKNSKDIVHRTLPWWTVTAADLPRGERDDLTEGAR